jgi:hypothetical protein
MLKSYFITGIRNLLKQKGYSFIKIIGLAFGLATSMMIYLYIHEDLSYDTFHQNYDRIVRLLTIDSAEGVSSKLVGVTQPRLAPAAEEELPEVIKSVRFTGGGRYDLSYKDNILKCDAAFRVDPSVFEVFDFNIIKGDKTALTSPGSIAIPCDCKICRPGKRSGDAKSYRCRSLPAHRTTPYRVHRGDHYCSVPGVCIGLFISSSAQQHVSAVCRCQRVTGKR